MVAIFCFIKFLLTETKKYGIIIIYKRKENIDMKAKEQLELAKKCKRKLLQDLHKPLVVEDKKKKMMCRKKVGDEE